MTYYRRRSIIPALLITSTILSSSGEVFAGSWSDKFSLGCGNTRAQKDTKHSHSSKKHKPRYYMSTNNSNNGFFSYFGCQSRPNLGCKSRPKDTTSRPSRLYDDNPFIESLREGLSDASKEAVIQSFKPDGAGTYAISKTYQKLGEAYSSTRNWVRAKNADNREKNNSSNANSYGTSWIPGSFKSLFSSRAAGDEASSDGQTQSQETPSRSNNSKDLAIVPVSASSKRQLNTENAQENQASPELREYSPESNPRTPANNSSPTKDSTPPVEREEEQGYYDSMKNWFNQKIYGNAEKSEDEVLEYLSEEIDSSTNSDEPEEDGANQQEESQNWHNLRQDEATNEQEAEGQETQEENEYEGLNLGAVGTETASDAEEQEEANEGGAQATNEQEETSEGEAQAFNEQQEASEGDAGIAAAAGYEDGHETSGENAFAASDSGIKPSGPSTKELLQEVGNFDDSVNDLLTDRLRETGGARRALASKSQPSSGISTGSGLFPENKVWAKAFMRGSYVNNADSKRDSLLGGAIIGIDNEVTDDITGGAAFQIGGGKSNKAGEKDASLFAVGGLLYERANIGENLSNNLSFQFSRNSISPENAEASDGQVIWNFRPTLGFDYDYSYGDFDISGGLSLYGQSRIAEENSHKTALKFDLETSYNINSGGYNVKPYLAVGGEWNFWESNAKGDEQLPEAGKISPVSDDSLVGGFSSGVKLDNDNYSLQLNVGGNWGWNKIFSSYTGAIKLSVKL